MMTFEEFFLKKKIDLQSLSTLKPDLFQEFKTHYAQMGEKSFDHTKKYWFNPLRKDFRLSEENELRLKESLNSVKTETVEIPSQTAVTESISTPVQGFKPRFKTTIAPIKQEEKIEESSAAKEKNKEEIVKPVGFKPRFKAASTSVKQDEKLVENLSREEKPKNETTKPIGFKPRYKASATPVKQEKEIEQTPLTEEKPKEEIIKPIGFKPRFKAGITSSKKSDNIN